MTSKVELNSLNKITDLLGESKLKINAKVTQKKGCSPT